MLQIAAGIHSPCSHSYNSPYDCLEPSVGKNTFGHVVSVDQNLNLYLHIVGLCQQKWAGVNWPKCL